LGAVRNPERQWPSGFLVFPLLTLCGFLAGLGIAHLAHAENGSNFTVTPQFKIWSSMTGAVIAVGFVIFVYSSSILLLLRSRFPQDSTWRQLIGSYTIFIALIFSVTIIFGSPDTSSVANYAATRTLLVLLSLLAAAPSIMGIWTIDWALSRMKDQIKQANKSQLKQILSDLILTRTKLLTLLSAIGALLGVSVLATGALRNAVLAAKPTNSKVVEYPIEYVLLYGLFFSALIVVVYVPAYFRLQDRSRDYIEMVFPLPDQGHYSSDDYTNRENLGKLLRIDASLQETLQTGLAIIAPLMATLLSLLLPVPK
jgi:hypothetical protein